MLAQQPELYDAIASHTWVGGSAASILGHKVIDNFSHELLTQVNHPMWNAQVSAHQAGSREAIKVTVAIRTLLPEAHA
jgi:negative regulator of replication initiation